MSCILDPKITAENLPFYLKDVTMMWGSACSRNRGVFVLDPPDGHTYNCAVFPEEWGVANVGEVLDFTEKSSPSKAVDILGKLIQAVYATSTTKDAGSCDFEGMSSLICGREEPWKDTPWFDKLQAPIRSVNIGGLFVLERWILPDFVEWGETTGIADQKTFSERCHDLGICDKLMDHWHNFYGPEDFMQMKEFGLNAIRLPLGWWYFAEQIGLSPSSYIVPTEKLNDRDHPITRVIGWAQDAGLQVMLDLHGAPGSQNGLDNSGVTASPELNRSQWGESWLYSPDNVGNTVKILAAVAEYCNHIDDSFGMDNVMALEILNEPWAYLDIGRVRDFYVASIEAVRLVRPSLPIIIHDSFRGPQWGTLLRDFTYPNIYMDTHVYHGFNPSDAASDTPKTDRQKMYTHERMACAYTGMLHFQTCTSLPTFVGEWSLAIDNCMPWLDPQFQDFGQCGDIEKRLKDSWWTEHIRSFSTRQIAMFEKELGWSFWCWKLSEGAMKNEPSAHFWSFQLAVNSGYIDISYNGGGCTHPPVENWEFPKSVIPHDTNLPPPPPTPVTEASTPAPSPTATSGPTTTTTTSSGSSSSSSSSSSEEGSESSKLDTENVQSEEPFNHSSMTPLAGAGLLIAALGVAIRRWGTASPRAVGVTRGSSSSYGDISAAMPALSSDDADTSASAPVEATETTKLVV
ncbi:unnamed protein product [Chrysoparadoxa australica]